MAEYLGHGAFEARRCFRVHSLAGIYCAETGERARCVSGLSLAEALVGFDHDHLCVFISLLFSVQYAQLEFQDESLGRVLLACGFKSLKRTLIGVLRFLCLAAVDAEGSQLPEGRDRRPMIDSFHTFKAVGGYAIHLQGARELSQGLIHTAQIVGRSHRACVFLSIHGLESENCASKYT